MTDPQKSRALIIAEQLDNAAVRIGESNPHLPSQRVIRIAKQAINQNQQLVECTAQSVVNACMKAAADGLVCDGREAALVPYKRKKKIGQKWEEWMEAQYIIMYRGMIKMMYRSDQVATVEIVNVYQNEYDDPERWEYSRGLQPSVTHRPIMIGERGRVVAIYSIVAMRGGGKTINVMTMEDIHDTVGRARDINPLWKLGDGGEQTHNYIEMCRKTVLRSHSKLLPFESDIAAAFDDHGAYFDDGYEPDADAAPGEMEIQKPRGKQRGAAAERLNPKPETVDAETGEITGGEEESRPLEMDTI